MLPVNSGGHSAYQDLVISQLRKYYPNPDLIPRSTWDIMEQFFLLDLSYVDQFMVNRYSHMGPKPRLPSCMLRSYLLSLKFKVPSITGWVRDLKLNHLYAIISGFHVDDTPGVGTFYDFFKRLWLPEEPNLSDSIQQNRKKVKRPRNQGEKAKSIEKETVEMLLKKFESNDAISHEAPAILFNLYSQGFLFESNKRGFINLDNLTIAGDGMPLMTSARDRKKRICDCFEKDILDCDCPRHYSQPDCDIGWDSSRERYYNGYDVYNLTVANSDSDLPIFTFLSPASRHDSKGFIHAWFAMKKVLPDISVRKLLLDSAHDAMPIYEYCKKNKITPFIDLNEKRGLKLKYKDNFTIEKDGIPICRAGLKMKSDGFERKKYRAKYRCPQYSRKNGCTCKNPCTE